MGKRDLVAEMLEVKGRRQSGLGRCRQAKLLELWSTHRSQFEAVSDFFPMRAVTLMEVFTRSWLAFLVDYGSPFTDNAEALVKAGIKLDFSVLRAVHVSQISIGELVAHSVSVNNVGDIECCLGTVLGRPFFASIADTYDRFAVERLKQPKVPIVRDMRRLKEDLAELFRIRHILTHETPRESVYAPSDVGRMLTSAAEFEKASDETLLSVVYGDYPLTTLDMQSALAEAASLADKKLEEAYTLLERVADSELVGRARAAWESYRDLQAELRSAHLAGGTYQSIAEARERKRLSEQQLENLQWFLMEREDGDVL